MKTFRHELKMALEQRTETVVNTWRLSALSHDKKSCVSILQDLIGTSITTDFREGEHFDDSKDNTIMYVDVVLTKVLDY